MCALLGVKTDLLIFLPVRKKQNTYRRAYLSTSLREIKFNVTQKNY
jgi:hypothetical protein